MRNDKCPICGSDLKMTVSPINPLMWIVGCWEDFPSHYESFVDANGNEADYDHYPFVGEPKPTEEDAWDSYECWEKEFTALTEQNKDQQ